MIIPKIGLTKEKRLPVLSFFNEMFYPHQALTFMWNTREWRVLEDDGKVVIVQSNEVRLKMTYYYALAMFREWNYWETLYLPSFSLQGKTVLDIGSGCGETAYFFFKHGAKKVLAVEPDPLAISFLKENARINGWDLEIIPMAFSLSLLDLTFDFIKMDCEGCEVQLLWLQKFNFPSVIEVHSREVMKSLVRKFNMKLARWHFPRYDMYILKKDLLHMYK